MLKLIIPISLITLIIVRESFATLSCANPNYGKCNCTGNVSVLNKQAVRETCKISTYLTWECNKCIFDEIANDTFRLFDLNYLHIRNSSLTKLNNWTKNIGGIIDIDLSYNNLTTLNNGIFNSGNKLNKLNFSNNKLKTIEQLFLINCTNLETFNISHNELVSLKKGICFLQVPLKELDASDNQIATIEGNALFSCTKLQKLNLSKNKLSKLEKDDLMSKELLELDLSYNQIRSFKIDAFSNMQNLITLNLSHNQFDFVSSNDIFRYLIDVEKIDLGFNKITKIAKNVFANNYKLINLILTGNSIETIERGSFNNLFYLLTLDLSKNQLHELDMYVFVNMYQLKKLYLNDNKFDNIDLVPYVKQNFHFNYLTIDNNKFCCPNLYQNLIELKKLAIQVQSGNISSATENQFDGIKCETCNNNTSIPIVNTNSLNLEDIRKLLDQERSVTNNLLIATLFFVIILVIVFISVGLANCNLSSNICRFRRNYEDIELIRD